MTKILIHGRRGSERLKIPLIPYDNPVAIKWVSELERTIQASIGVLEKNRIYALSNDWTEKEIISDIEKCVAIIAKEVPNLRSFNLEGANQDLMNRLHAEYGKLIGPDDQRNNLESLYTLDVVQSIRDLNVLIHRFESFMRHHNNPNYGRIVVTFEQKRKVLFSEDEFHLFTPNYNPGDIVLNYCIIGKSILDYIADGDSQIPMNYVSPQTKWCADFMMVLTGGPGHYPQYEQVVGDFWQKNRSWMEKHGYFEGDPKLALGGLPVAHTEEDPIALKKRIFGIDTVESVEVLRG